MALAVRVEVVARAQCGRSTSLRQWGSGAVYLGHYETSFRKLHADQDHYWTKPETGDGHPGKLVGGLTGAASWEKGAVYVRQSEELLIEMWARIGVVMDCPEAKFMGAEVRLDSAGDGHGKLIASCTRATP